MYLGRVCLILTLFINAGINAFPLKLMIAKAIKWEIESWRNVVLSMVFTLIPVIISSNFTQVTDYVTLAGSFTGCLICFTFPGLIGIKIRYFKNTLKHNLLIGWTVVITILCLISTYYALLNFIEKKPDK